VAGVGMRLSNASRRGRALLIFTAGIALLVAASAFLVGRAVGGTRVVGVSTAATLAVCAMGVVAAGALLPALEDWVGARRDLRRIAALRAEMGRRHPDIGIGVRPRGPLVFRVAEQLSLISDAIYLEGARAPRNTAGTAEPPAAITITEQARAVARWIASGPDEVVGPDEVRPDEVVGAAFPGRGWLRQPPDCPDRDWILEIADQYRLMAEEASKAGGFATLADQMARPRPGA